MTVQVRMNECRDSLGGVHGDERDDFGELRLFVGPEGELGYGEEGETWRGNIGLVDVAGVEKEGGSEGSWRKRGEMKGHGERGGK